MGKEIKFNKNMVPTHVWCAILRSPVNVEVLAPVSETEETCVKNAEFFIAAGNEKGFNFRRGPHELYPHYWISMEKKMTLSLLKIPLVK